LNRSGKIEIEERRGWSVWLDIVILARTVTIVQRGRGAY
jgi:lipopolysaccharide/colanic/teichoic acid biosynthesis glycosyltransferase